MISNEIMETIKNLKGEEKKDFIKLACGYTCNINGEKVLYFSNSSDCVFRCKTCTHHDGRCHMDWDEFNNSWNGKCAYQEEYAHR